MSTRARLSVLVLVSALGCGDGGTAPSGVPATPAGDSFASPEQVPLQFEVGRDFAAEAADFRRLLKETRADPTAVRQALGIAPTSHSSYTTITGKSMSAAEYKLQGPRPGAPFFEAYAEHHPGQSFYVFYEKSWFRWRAVDCGFHDRDMLGPKPGQD